MEFGLLQLVSISLFVIGVAFYVYIASKNPDEVEVQFLGDKKKMPIRTMIIICLVDGIFLGLLLGYILFEAISF